MNRTPHGLMAHAGTGMAEWFVIIFQIQTFILASLFADPATFVFGECRFMSIVLGALLGASLLWSYGYYYQKYRARVIGMLITMVNFLFIGIWLMLLNIQSTSWGVYITIGFFASLLYRRLRRDSNNVN